MIRNEFFCSMSLASIIKFIMVDALNHTAMFYIITTMFFSKIFVIRPFNNCPLALGPLLETRCICRKKPARGKKTDEQNLGPKMRGEGEKKSRGFRRRHETSRLLASPPLC